MRFSLLLLGSPYSTQSTLTAYRFAEAVVKAGHQLYRVFFYHDAVYCGHTHTHIMANTTLDCPTQWKQLAKTHNIDLVICYGNAVKRGLSPEPTGSSSATIMDPAFELAGLTQLIDATMQSDRLITFGP